MPQPQPTSYDEVPYPGQPFRQTHPSSLAAIATLLGLQPTPVRHCRVLELGCTDGANLIPMACTLPDSRFVGIDLSPRQVADGQKVIQALGLGNIELKALNILDIGPDLGSFDYIICHGVYSWVPAPVQNGILEVCARCLTPDGVAFVSYNTYPGWHMRGMIRDMMMYHSNHFPDPRTRIAQARALLDFLAKSVAQDSNPYGLLLKGELKFLNQSSDNYLFHDYLEEYNEPLYFHQFAERIAARGLQYLGDAELQVMVPANFAPEVREVLGRISADMIHLEQYMDFVRNRLFRQSLLCHRHQRPSYKIRPERLAGCHLASPLKPEAADPDIHTTALVPFRSPSAGNITSNIPLVKAALICLAEVWPRSLAFDALLQAARERLQGGAPQAPAGAEDVRLLAESLLRIYTKAGRGLLEVELEPSCFAGEVSQRPTASPLARVQAATGNRVTNLRHESAYVDECGRQLLMLLDGTRDRASLFEALDKRVSQGALVLHQQGQPIKDREEVRKVLNPLLDQQLLQLAKWALLVG